MSPSSAPPYLTSDQTSFAFVSARDRWPVILTQAIDDVFKTTRDSTDPVHTAEGKKLVSELAKLKYELQHDRVLTPLEPDGGADIEVYNTALKALGESPKWFSTPWLFTECYLYRRLRCSFASTKTWTTYDPFANLKSSTLKSSLPAVLELATRYLDLVNTPAPSGDSEKLQLLFTEIFEISLWGNATDLSLLTSLSYDELQALQGEKARKESEKNILANDIASVFDTIVTAGKPGRVDIVLDNAGFELYVDLVMAGWLLASGLATEVVLHPKNIPWFVSDVMPTDFAALLNALHDSAGFFGGEAHANLEGVFKHWSSLHGEGKLRIQTNDFWTGPYSYMELPARAPELWKDLQQSELVVFKGDLNYRKLTGDLAWHPETRFVDAIGELGKEGNGVRVLALRTCKADVVVGLDKGKDEELRAGDKERKWAWAGKYAVIQFFDGKKA